MAAFEKLHGGFTLTDAAFAGQQHTLAVNLHQHTVACDAGRQRGFQIGDDGGDHGAGGIGRAQQRHIVLFCHLQNLGAEGEIAGDQQGGEFIGEEPVQNGGPGLIAEPVQVAHFHIAQNLQAHGVEMVEITCQLNAGT